MIWKIGFAAVLQLFAANQIFSQVVEIRPISTRRDVTAPASSPLIRASANLVLVHIHITNHAGVTVNGLEKSAFTILEDKVPQSIVSFGNEDVPSSVGVILDLSGSMSTKLRLAAAALHSFLETANPADEAFLLTVSSRPRIVSEFTTDFGLLQNRLVTAEAGGATALIDTIYMGLTRLRTARNAHKALLIISDGMDNHSRYTQPELLRTVAEADVQIYTVGIADWPAFKKPIELTEERNGQFFLQALADNSGGLNQVVKSFEDAPNAAAKLSRAIRDQYVIGYYPLENQDSGKWHAIQVKVNLPRIHVSARTGYYVR
jgi:Ca-activated chloride channel family protein